VAGSVLGSCGATAEYKVTQRSADRARNHDPAIVGHEDEPGRVRLGQTAELDQQNLHDHKGVKVLNSIENTLDEVGAAGDLDFVLS